jgi:hypothetical protein
MKFRPGLVVAVATAILLASCGGGDSEGAQGTEQPADAQQGTTTAELGPICENPPPTPMSLGTPVSGEVPGFDQCYTVEVPAGAARLTVELTGMTEPLNLRVGYGSVDTVQFHIGDFWQSSEDGTADEMIVIENPKAGTYYVNVAVATFRDMSPFTLSVTSS